MKNEINCNIVEDLLPAYIDSILSKESKTFVQKHLETCENCQKTYHQMTSSLQKEDVENTENIKTIKKYRKKIKALKILLTLFLISILTFFLCQFGFRYLIVKNALTKNIHYEVSRKLPLRRI